MTQPRSPATSTTAGNGTPKTVSARNDATASPTRTGWCSARLPTLYTAWITMAMTAGASPAKSPATTAVDPAPT